MDSLFLTLEEVLQIHDQQIADYGGQSGVLNRGALESSVAQPSSDFFGQLRYPDVASQAAAYLFYIANNHAFVDGNKRTALASALTFLDLNAYGYDRFLPIAFQMTVDVASNKLSLDQLIELFRTMINPVAEIGSQRFWTDVDNTFLALVPQEQAEHPRLKKFGRNVLMAMASHGVIGLTAKQAEAHIVSDGREVLFSGLNIQFEKSIKFKRMANDLGFDLQALRRMHKRGLPHILGSMCIEFSNAMIKSGIGEITFNTMESIIGFNHNGFNVSGLSFGIMSEEDREHLAHLYGIDLALSDE